MPTIDEIVIADPVEAWRDAGFTVDDDGVSRVGTVRLRLVGRNQGKRIIGWSLRDVDGLDELPTTVSDAPASDPAEHPNGVTFIDHLVVATPNLSRTVKALEVAGLDLKRTRDSDTYGTPMRQCFFKLAEVILEVIGDPEAENDGNAIFYGLAHTVTDLDATKEFLGEHLKPPKPAVQEGRRIATLRHKELGMSVATVFMSA